MKELTAGETILAGTKEVTARETIPAGHKMATAILRPGAEVIKYGFRIGNAKENIAAGQWVHVHNLKTALGDLLEYTYEPVETNVKKTEDVKFMGFARANGKVGVRNEVWIIPTVGCVNNIATAMAKAANARVKGSVEKVIAFPASVWMFPDGRRPGAHQNDSGGSGKSSECGRRSRARTGM